MLGHTQLVAAKGHPARSFPPARGRGHGTGEDDPHRAPRGKQGRRFLLLCTHTQHIAACTHAHTHRPTPPVHSPVLVTAGYRDCCTVTGTLPIAHSAVSSWAGVNCRITGVSAAIGEVVCVCTGVQERRSAVTQVNTLFCQGWFSNPKTDSPSYIEIHDSSGCPATATHYDHSTGTGLSRCRPPAARARASTDCPRIPYVTWWASGFASRPPPPPNHEPGPPAPPFPPLLPPPLLHLPGRRLPRTSRVGPVLRRVAARLLRPQMGPPAPHRVDAGAAGDGDEHACTCTNVQVTLVQVHACLQLYLVPLPIFQRIYSHQQTSLLPAGRAITQFRGLTRVPSPLLFL